MSDERSTGCDWWGVMLGEDDADYALPAGCVIRMKTRADAQHVAERAPESGRVVVRIIPEGATL